MNKLLLILCFLLAILAIIGYKKPYLFFNTGTETYHHKVKYYDTDVIR